MTLNLATLIQRITGRDAVVTKAVAVPAAADPFDRLARIVRVERAREAVPVRVSMYRHAG
jgi:hypothetical protein